MSSPRRGWIKDTRNKAGRKEPNCLIALAAWGGGRRGGSYAQDKKEQETRYSVPSCKGVA